MKKYIKQLFCTHPATGSEVVGGIMEEYRIIYSSPWSLFGTKETLYKCNKCGKKYYYPSGNQEEKRMNENFFNYLNNLTK